MLVGGRSHELLAVWVKRYDEAIAAGLDQHQAREFADSDTDVGELRELVRRGCPPELIARLVL
jgi:hypothetical protein